MKRDAPRSSPHARRTRPLAPRHGRCDASRKKNCLGKKRSRRRWRSRTSFSRSRAIPVKTARRARKSKSKPEPPLNPIVPLDRRLKRKLFSGKAHVDDKIDLHGMTQARAHQALNDFLWRAANSGAKSCSGRYRQGQCVQLRRTSRRRPGRASAPGSALAALPGAPRRSCYPWKRRGGRTADRVRFTSDCGGALPSE